MSFCCGKRVSAERYPPVQPACPPKPNPQSHPIVQQAVEKYQDKRTSSVDSIDSLREVHRKAMADEVSIPETIPEKHIAPVNSPISSLCLTPKQILESVEGHDSGITSTEPEYTQLPDPGPPLSPTAVIVVRPLTPPRFTVPPDNPHEQSRLQAGSTVASKVKYFNDLGQPDN